MKPASVLLSLLVLAAPARAGIYNTTETEDAKLDPNVLKFRDTLSVVRTIGFDVVDVDWPLRKRYVFAEALAGSKAPSDLTLEQKLDYSAVLLRRKKFQQAVDFLVPLTRQHPELFLFDSHLAMAYWGSGQAGNDRRAVEVMSQMLSKRGWPENIGDVPEEQRKFFEKSMGWDDELFKFYRKREQYLLKLMKLRLGEPAGKPFEAVDALFDDNQKPPQPVKFVNEQGTFEPGAMAPAEAKKLPRDAIEIVEQLLLWLPEDARLYWLLGELANVQWKAEQLTLPDRKTVSPQEFNQAVAKKAHALANLTATKKIFDELVYEFKVRAPEVRARRQTLDDFAQAVNKKTSEKLEEWLDDRQGPPAMRTLAVTFAAGLAVGIFALWQYQEIRRRRRG